MDDDRIGPHEVNVREVADPNLDEEELLRRKGEAIRQFLDALMLLRSYIPLNHLITVLLLASVTFIKSGDLGSGGWGRSETATRKSSLGEWK